MSDLISRQEVLKAVSERKKAYETSIKDDYIDGGLDACEEIEEAIKKLPFQWSVEVIHGDKIKYPTQNKWISVDDKFPNEGEEVLCSDGYMSFIDRILNGKWERENNLHSHWQPLPQPPLLDK